RTKAQKRNAILALKKLDGAVIAPGETFSFNTRVGTWSRDQGYRRAPVSYNGTLIASWGGGVCQTSTTLYNAALLAGMKIIDGGTNFIKNTGKPGCEVWTYRVTGGERELLSVDHYPVMNKIEEGE